MRALQIQGYSVNAMKPVAAGCDWQQGGWRNQDALLFQEYASVALNYEQINPFAFAQAVSPHVACGVTEVDPSKIVQGFHALRRLSDHVLVEGAGGWFSPLGQCLDNASLAKALQLPVILVVGLRLGCINHACLSFQAIIQAKLNCAAWLAVQLEPEMPALAANLEYLQNKLQTRYLGMLPFLPQADFDFLATHIKTSELHIY